jgi:hypothetical protein
LPRCPSSSHPTSSSRSASDAESSANPCRRVAKSANVRCPTRSALKNAARPARWQPRASGAG